MRKGSLSQVRLKISEIPSLPLLALLKGSSSHYVIGGGRGIGLALCTAIIDAGGYVGILDILKEPHPD